MFKESGFEKAEDWWRRIDRKVLSVEMNEDGFACKMEFLSSLRGKHVSFSIDAYTLYHRHQIAGMICAPQLGLRPRLVYLVQDSNVQQSYANAGRYFENIVRFFSFLFFFSFFL
jgi:hypothetical protein